MSIDTHDRSNHFSAGSTGVLVTWHLPGMSSATSTSPSVSSHAATTTTRRWLKRAVIGLLIAVNLLVGFVYWQLRRVEAVVQAEVVALPEVVPVLTPTVPGNNEPVTFLLVGSDSRAGLEDTEGFGDFEGSRSDSIILIKLYPDGGRAQVLSFPRDLWVAIPGEGEGKLNSAFGIGGAPLLVETVKAETGLDVHHYVEVDFLGFESIIDQIGGVTIDFSYPARDSKSGLEVEAGTHSLDGATALAYARSRHYQELRDGEWVSVEADDFGRTHRQQALILALLDGIARPSSLTEAATIVGSLARHLSIDAALAQSSLIELAFRMRSLSRDSIETATLPGDIGTVGEQSVVFRRDPEATALIAAMRDGDSIEQEEVADTPLTLEVLNGNGTPGIAGTWADALKEQGFLIGAVGDADRNDFAETVVVVRAGQEDRGESVIDALGFGRVAVGVLATGIDAQVILGGDVPSEVSSG